MPINPVASATSASSQAISEAKGASTQAATQVPRPIILVFSVGDRNNLRYSRIKILQNTYGQDSEIICVDPEKDLINGKTFNLDDPTVRQKYASLLNCDANTPLIIDGHSGAGSRFISSDAANKRSVVKLYGDGVYSAEVVATFINASATTSICVHACEGGQTVRGQSFLTSLASFVEGERNISAFKPILFEGFSGRLRLSPNRFANIFDNLAFTAKYWVSKFTSKLRHLLLLEYIIRLVEKYTTKPITAADIVTVHTTASRSSPAVLEMKAPATVLALRGLGCTSATNVAMPESKSIAPLTAPVTQIVTTNDSNAAASVSSILPATMPTGAPSFGLR